MIVPQVEQARFRLRISPQQATLAGHFMEAWRS
jgi:hypothetical protein